MGFTKYKVFLRPASAFHGFIVGHSLVRHTVIHLAHIITYCDGCAIAPVVYSYFIHGGFHPPLPIYRSYGATKFFSNQ
jgi:hypothetical protein